MLAHVHPWTLIEVEVEVEVEVGRSFTSASIVVVLGLQGNCVVWNSIPFAAPPVGDLRFARTWVAPDIVCCPVAF
jgi:hypothetical protein